MKILVGVLLAVNIAMLIAISMQPDDGPPRLKTTTNMPALTLLSELTPQQLAKLVGEQQPGKDVGTVKARKALVEVACYAIGPYNKDIEAIGSAGTLTSLGLVTEIRFDKQREVSGYWVYIKPLPSRADAKKVTRMLTERAVKDFHIVPKGLNKNAISLGFFSTRAAAEQRRARMQAIGLSPSLDDRYREIEGYWLHFSSPNHPPLPAEIIETMQTRHKGISLRDRKCS